MSTGQRVVSLPTGTPTSGSPVAGRHRAGLRLRPGRPVRLLLALSLMVVAVVFALAMFLRVGHRHEVLVLTRDVLAGERLTDADVQPVAIAADDTLRATLATARGSVVGQYAKVRMVHGSLLVEDSLQAAPLVDAGKAVVSLPVTATQVPTGLREGSRLLVTVIPATAGPAVLVEAFAVAPPRFDAGAAAGSLTVQVPLDQVALVTTGSKIVVSVIDPSAPLPAGVAG